MPDDTVASQAPGASFHPLIASDRVEGTPVRRPNGDPLGRIERLMIDKASGRVDYAVMSFGGFLGIGEEHLTLPWSALDFDPALDAYALDLSDDQLCDAPRRTERGDDVAFDRAWEEHVHRYYDAGLYRDMSS